MCKLFVSFSGVSPPEDDEASDICGDLRSPSVDTSDDNLESREQSPQQQQKQQQQRGRNERTEGRRYHTASAIEDIKVGSRHSQ